MHQRRGARRALLTMTILTAGLAALAAEGARAADCYAPLALSDKWSCMEEGPDIGIVAYCLNATAPTGAGVDRTFGIHTPGSAPRPCTCGAKGKGANARHNAGNTFLCYDDARDLVESGTITRKRITSEIFVASENSRRTVTCRPDPACLVLE